MICRYNQYFNKNNICFGCGFWATGHKSHNPWFREVHWGLLLLLRLCVDHLAGRRPTINSSCRSLFSLFPNLILVGETVAYQVKIIGSEASYMIKASKISSMLGQCAAYLCFSFILSSQAILHILNMSPT